MFKQEILKKLSEFSFLLGQNEPLLAVSGVLKISPILLKYATLDGEFFHAFIGKKGAKKDIVAKVGYHKDDKKVNFGF